MSSVLFELYGNAFVETATDNEIDELFCQLECKEPPTYMVDSIMNAVARLPRYGNVSNECDDTIAMAM